MLRSMTGFGRAVLDVPAGRLTAEIQSVNRKYLEVSVSAPKEFGKFEPFVRKWVGDALSRGQVSVKIYFLPAMSAIEELLPDVKILKGLKKSWDHLAKEVGAPTVDLPFLMQYMPLPAREASDKELKALEQCMEEALNALVQMKTQEGKALGVDLADRLKALQKMLGEIERHAPDATQRMRAKLFEKMEGVLKMGPELEERLLREVALFADRVDISEEITRFRSHVEQFQKLLKDESVGRKMDFLLQEMGREVNTIGSKSMEASIAHKVVEMKAELEKMREQVQNIE